MPIILCSFLTRHALSASFFTPFHIILYSLAFTEDHTLTTISVKWQNTKMGTECKWTFLCNWKAHAPALHQNQLSKLIEEKSPCNMPSTRPHGSDIDIKVSNLLAPQLQQVQFSAGQSCPVARNGTPLKDNMFQRLIHPENIRLQLCAAKNDWNNLEKRGGLGHFDTPDSWYSDQHHGTGMWENCYERQQGKFVTLWKARKFWRQAAAPST